LRSIRLAIVFSLAGYAVPATSRGQISVRGALTLPSIPASHSCRIPDDWIDNKRYPLFLARSVLQALLEQLKS
jgi:hypothetical protein